MPNRYILSNFNKHENKNYLAYCYQEIQDFNYVFDENAYNIKFKIYSNISDRKRKKGEDDTKICKLIRKDSIDDFISYVSKHKIDFSARIKPSIYETNSFLLKKGFNLIEYAAFSGSIKIFKYLYSIKAEFDQSIWQYAIHGRNSDIIHIIESVDFSKEKIDFDSIYIESIKCFNKDISNYLEENYREYIKINFRQILKTYNFEYFTIDFFNEPDILFELCHYDYIAIVEILLKTADPDCQTKKKKDCFVISAKKGNIGILKLLLQRKKVNINSKKLLTYAIISENNEMAQFLLNQDNIKINSYQNLIFGTSYKIKETYLCTAIRKENLEIVKMLLNHKKIDVNTFSTKESLNENVKERKPALCVAIETGNIEIIKLLLNRKDIKVNKPLIIQYEDKKGEVIKKVQKPILNLAIEQNSTEIIKLLLNTDKIDVNSESTTDNFTYDFIRKSFGIALFQCLIYPFLKYLMNNNYLFVLIYLILMYLWAIR